MQHADKPRQPVCYDTRGNRKGDFVETGTDRCSGAGSWQLISMYAFPFLLLSIYDENDLPTGIF